MIFNCQDTNASLLSIHVIVHAVMRAKEYPAGNGWKGCLVVGVVLFTKIWMLG